MKKFIIITTLLFLGVCFVTYYYFEKLNNSNSQNELALQTALQHSFCTLAFNNESTFFEATKDYTLFDELAGEDKSNEILAIKNLIIKNDKVNRWISNRKIFVSLVPDGKNAFDLVYYAQLNKDAQINELLKALNTGGTKASIENEQFKIEGQLGEIFYAMIRNNMAIISKNSSLVQLIAQNKLNDIHDDMKEFLFSDENNSKNTLIQLYLNTKNADDFYKILLVNHPDGILKELPLTDGVSVLDFNYSKNKLQFTGSSKMSRSDNYLSSFLNQKPQSITITPIFPSNTAMYAIYTFSDFNQWQIDFEKSYAKNQRFIENRNKLIEKNQKQDSVALLSFFGKFTQNEIAYLQLNTGEKLGILKLQHTLDFQNEVKKISTESTDSTFRFKTQGILPHIFGSVFEDFGQPYLKVIGNYLVFSNNISSIQSFEDTQQHPENLLQQTVNYTDFSNKIIPEANVSYFVNNFEGKTVLKNQIRWDLFQYYIPDKSKYHQIYGMGVQLSAENNYFQTTLTITNRVDRTDF